MAFRLYRTSSAIVRQLHDGDPSLLATYFSFPTSEYLDVEGSDFLAFNVFLERPSELARYIAHLHVLARNAGLEVARGDRIAYLDADAACDPDWPYHLAFPFEGGVDATGGPSLLVPSAGFAERVVAHSPGGPMHVLITDDRAEHVVDANMAFRRTTLHDLGGFDVAYTSAGDDVDICWRLLDAGHEIGFAHAAQVWHHRRDSLGRYLREQGGYGRSERMVSGRHRERFNRHGQAKWAGFLYSSPRLRWPLLRPVLYHGYVGMAPFQRVSRWRAQAAMQSGAALMPLLVPVAILGLILGFVSTWALLIPTLAVASVASYASLAAGAIRPHHQEPHPYRLRLLAGVMHAIQPFVRAWGRITTRPLQPLQRSTIPGPATGRSGCWICRVNWPGAGVRSD